MIVYTDRISVHLHLCANRKPEWSHFTYFGDSFNLVTSGKSSKLARSNTGGDSICSPILVRIFEPLLKILLPLALFRFPPTDGEISSFRVFLPHLLPSVGETKSLRPDLWLRKSLLPLNEIADSVSGESNDASCNVHFRFDGVSYNKGLKLCK